MDNIKGRMSMKKDNPTGAAMRCQDDRFHDHGTSNLPGRAQPCPAALTRIALDEAQDIASISK